MNAITPPKLMPLFHRTAANGTLPTEQTNETTATSGPTTGPQNNASVGWVARKNDFQNVFGTHAASAPAMSSPPRTSRHTAAQSMRKQWLIAVKRVCDVIR